MKNKKIVLLIVLLLVCVLSLTACGEASLSDLQEEATASLDTALATYTESDYSADNYALITAAYDTALAGINAVTDKANLPGSFVSTFVSTADEVVTIAEQEAADTAALAAAKTTAIEELDTELAKYDSADYSTDNYATITTAYDTAKAGIEAVTDIANLPGDFVATFTTAAEEVVTIAEQAEIDAAALVVAKANAIESLDTALAKYDSADYTTATYAVITNAYNTALSNINAVTDIANLPGSFVESFTSTADRVVTIAEQEAADAEALAAKIATELALLDTALETYDSEDYTVDNYATITTAYATAKAGIEAVTDIADLPGYFLSTFEATANDVETIAETLAAAKASAIESLDTALASYTESDYTADSYALITAAYATAKADINAVTDAANLPGEFVATFTDYADRVLTEAEQAAADAAALAAKIAAELAVLDTALATYTESSYTVDNYATITAAYATAKAGIEAVTDIANLPGTFVSTFTTAASAVVTIAQQTAADLADKQAEVIADLDTALATYSESNYSATNYALITSAYATAKAGINGVTDIADLPGDFVSTFTTAADAVDDIYVGFSFTENTDGTYTVSSYTGTATEVIVPSTYNGSAVTAIAAGTDASSGVFYYNTNIVSVILPDSITSIGSYAFYACTNLASINISESITSVGASAFYSCSNLTSVYYTGTLDQWSVVSFSSNTANPMAYASHFYCDGDYDNEVTTIELSGDKSYVNNFVFWGFVNVTSVEIGEGVKIIGSYAFYNCTLLSEINLPDTLTTINSYAFFNCPSLYEINLPDSIESVGTLIVSTYRLTEDGRTGTTFVVNCASTLLLMINNISFYAYSSSGVVYYPENTLQLGADIYFESGMETAAINSYFYGTIDGTDAMYSLNDIELLSYSILIYQAGDSTYKNLVINVGQTGGIFVCYAAGNYAEFENIETYGDVYVTSGTANYSPILAIGSWSGTTVYFTNVTTYTNLTILGSGYFSNFLGGYCYGNVVFENCINYGDMIGEYPSVFVGNYNAMSAEQITIKESVYNLGTIIGYGGAGYFGAKGNGDSDCAEYVEAIEAFSINVSPQTIEASITVTDNDGIISISDSAEGATQYLVSYSAYASLTGEVSGSRFITISFLVSADSMTETGLPTSVIMTSTLHEGVVFEASNTNTIISAMLYEYEGVWYLYVDTSELTGSSANCLLDNKTASILVIGLEDNGNFVSIQS